MFKNGGKFQFHAPIGSLVDLSFLLSDFIGLLLENIKLTCCKSRSELRIIMSRAGRIISHSGLL